MKVGDSSNSSASSTTRSSSSSKTESSSSTSNTSDKDPATGSASSSTDHDYVPSWERSQEFDAPESEVSLDELQSSLAQNFCDFIQGDRDTNAQGVQEYMNSQDPAAYQQALEQSGVQMGTGAGAEPGTLFIDDQFTVADTANLADPDLTGHGYNVADAARDQGFEGPIVGSNSLPAMNHVANTQGAIQALETAGQDQQAALQSLDLFTTSMAGGLLEQKRNTLQALTCDGVTQSAVNFSQGQTPATVVDRLYGDMSPVLSGQPSSDPAEAAAQQNLVDNLASAFAVDQQALNSADPAIQQEAQQQLMQGLVDRVSDTFANSPDLEFARGSYDMAVANFEAGNNSVVVSSGNQNYVAQDLTEEFGALNFPSNFTSNVLDTSQSTAVGATYGSGATLQEAGYSNPGEVYANGTVTYPNTEVQGTSFASPRYAAVAAEMHGQNPSFSSAQVEAAIAGQMTHTLATQSGTSAVLDPTSVASFLQAAQ